jgi:hypothetical protein
MKCRLPSPLICISITTQRRKMRFTTLHCWKGGRIYFTLVITVSLQPYTFGQVVTVINGYHRAGPRRARGLVQVKIRGAWAPCPQVENRSTSGGSGVSPSGVDLSGTLGVQIPLPFPSSLFSSFLPFPFL